MEIKVTNDVLNNLKLYSISIETANIERRLVNSIFKLKKTKKKLPLDFGIAILKDVKYIYNNAAAEHFRYGDTEIYQELVETLYNTENTIGQLSISLCGTNIQGLSNIITNYENIDFDKISKIEFGIPSIVNNILYADNHQE